MRQHVILTPVHAPPHSGHALKDLVHSQEFRDKLYVVAVTALVLVTIALCAGYAIHMWPQWRAGVIGGFDTVVLPLPDQGDGTDAALVTGSEPAAGVNRTSLIVTSMLVEAAIFVGLGLYLRHEMKRKP